jgi:TfoX/Sxy family transcriptional regulator of competence genes
MARWKKTRDSAALAARLRGALQGRARIAEKRMFGGVCVLLRGNMLCGSATPGFMFRVGKEQDREARARKGARPLAMNGRRLEGFVWVDPAACDARALRRWIAMSESYVGTFPAKRG